MRGVKHTARSGPGGWDPYGHRRGYRTAQGGARGEHPAHTMCLGLQSVTRQQRDIPGTPNDRGPRRGPEGAGTAGAKQERPQRERALCVLCGLAGPYGLGKPGPATALPPDTAGGRGPGAKARPGKAGRGNVPRVAPGLLCAIFAPLYLYISLNDCTYISASTILCTDPISLNDCTYILASTIAYKIYFRCVHLIICKYVHYLT